MLYAIESRAYVAIHFPTVPKTEQSDLLNVPHSTTMAGSLVEEVGYFFPVSPSA
jgi:hypothetical protein